MNKIKNKMTLLAAMIYTGVLIAICVANIGNGAAELDIAFVVDEQTATPTIYEKYSDEPEYYTEVTSPDFHGYEHYVFTNEEIELLAKTVWGEARGCSADEQTLVVWTVLQRVDGAGFPNTIAGVVTARNAFHGYKEDNPIDPAILAMCHEQIWNWAHFSAPPTHEIYAPTLPYYFFEGDGKHNYFRAEWR